MGVGVADAIRRALEVAVWRAADVSVVGSAQLEPKQRRVAPCPRGRAAGAGKKAGGCAARRRKHADAHTVRRAPPPVALRVVRAGVRAGIRAHRATPVAGFADAL